LAELWLKSGVFFSGAAGSCWAFGSLSAVDSRLCIATDGIFSGSQAQLSRGFATSFSKPGGGDGCQGLRHPLKMAGFCGFLLGCCPNLIPIIVAFGDWDNSGWLRSTFSTKERHEPFATSA